jgi:hypothetical protein
VDQGIDGVLGERVADIVRSVHGEMSQRKGGKRFASLAQALREGERQPGARAALGLACLAKKAESEGRWIDAASYYHGAEFYLPAGDVRNGLYYDIARNWARGMKGIVGYERFQVPYPTSAIRRWPTDDGAPPPTPLSGAGP